MLIINEPHESLLIDFFWQIRTSVPSIKGDVRIFASTPSAHIVANAGKDLCSTRMDWIARRGVANTRLARLLANSPAPTFLMPIHRKRIACGSCRPLPGIASSWSSKASTWNRIRSVPTITLSSTTATVRWIRVWGDFAAINYPIMWWPAARKCSWPSPPTDPSRRTASKSNTPRVIRGG